MGSNNLNTLGENRIKYLPILWYFIPLLISVIYIYSSGSLIGDFLNYPFFGNAYDLMYLSFFYILPIIIIFYAAKFSEKYRSRDEQFSHEDTLFWTLMVITLFAGIFGLPKVGALESSDGSITQTVQRLVMKLNPGLIFLLFAFTSKSTAKIIISSLCQLILAYVQTSLLPVFLISIALTNHFFVTLNISKKKIAAGGAILFIFWNALFSAFIQLYSLRNSLRGAVGDFDYENITEYVFGRINSFSSFYYIWNEDCCAQPTSPMYLVASVVERFGIQLNTLNPTNLLNNDLGSYEGNYTIFTSMAGAFLIEWRSDPFSMFVTVISLIVLVFLIYQITPLKSGKHKPFYFTLLIFPPYLSGDAWEISIFIQAIIVISVYLYCVKQVRLTIYDTRSAEAVT